MDPISYFNSMNLFFVFSFSVITLLVVTFITYRMGKRSRLISEKEPSDFITNNILGLLALILGFSFSLVVDRFEKRRGLGMDELNAITTVYQRAKVIHFKNPEKLKELIGQYIELRINSHKFATPDDAIKEMVQIKAAIWKTFMEVAEKERGELESEYMQALNEMFTTGNTRYIAMMKMLPPIFYFIILAMASAAMGLMNFDRGYSNDTRHWRTILFVFLFALIFTFIFDIDHSKSGLVQIKDPLLILRSVLASQ